MRRRKVFLLLATFILNLSSCAKPTIHEDTGIHSKLTPNDYGIKSKKIYVGLLNSHNSSFHPWTKEMLLSENYFRSCMRSHAPETSFEAVVRWAIRNGQIVIDQDKKSGHPPDFLICVADRLKEWLAERRNLDRGDQQGIFYLVETKEALGDLWPISGEKYYWQMKVINPKLRMMQ